MNKKLKMGIALGTVILVIGLLFAQGFKASGGMGMYLTIEEALANYQSNSDKFIQMEGKVVGSSVRYDRIKPSLIFELTGLDHQAIEILNCVLGNLNTKDRTIFMITHNFEQGLDLSDRVLIVVKGRIAYERRAQGLSPDEMKTIYLNTVGGKVQ